MRALVVIAHPSAASLCAELGRAAEAALRAAGHDVEVDDLYAQGFSPVLTRGERAGYYEPGFASAETARRRDQLLAAEALVLVFPTWWFSPPAMLKGWFDRIWAPGTAFDHAPDGAAIRPKLVELRHVLAVTTLGSPWWVDWLVMRRPVRRILRLALVGACAPKARFRMLSFYNCEALGPALAARAVARVDRAARRM